MINKVKRIISRYRMITPGDRIIVGVSGGPDSRALLQILFLLADEYRLELIAAHLNHGLRGGDAEEDEEFAAHCSESLGIPFERKSLDILALSKEYRKSVEEIGRDERYTFLTEIAQKHNADKIALGHHLHDQVETVLMNLLRGCGVEGLRGMLPVRDGIIIRPLLSTTREEILSFLEERKLSYRNDTSNFDNACLRNRIRNRLLPLLKVQYNPKIETAMAHLSEIAGQDEAYLQDVVRDAMSRLGIDGKGEEITIAIPLFLRFPEAIQRRLIKTLLERLAPAGKTIGYSHVKSVLDLIQRGLPSGRLNLPGSLQARRRYEELSVIRTHQGIPSRGKRACPDDADEAFFSYDVEIPGRIELRPRGAAITFDFFAGIPSPAHYRMPNVIYLDYDRVSAPLCIRNRRPGDRIQPLGMEGTKKIKACLIDKKIPRHRREKILLLADQESVLWVIGVGMSERVKVTDKTVTVVKAEIV